MSVELFVRGLAIGFAVALALGPIGLLVIRRTIDGGWARGVVSGFGVATADALYSALAAFGLSTATEVLVGIDRPLGVAGGAVLLILAIRGLRSAGGSDAQAGEPADLGAPGRMRGLGGAWASMVALTLANPMTILSFAALFAGTGVGSHGAAGALAVVVGVFLGSAAWWAILTGFVAELRARLTPRIVRGLNATSAILIGSFGIVAIVLGLIA